MSRMSRIFCPFTRSDAETKSFVSFVCLVFKNSVLSVGEMFKNHVSNISSREDSIKKKLMIPTKSIVAPSHEPRHGA